MLLFIIQSLRVTERQTGTLLLEDIAPRRHLVEKCEFLLRDVSTQVELVSVLDEIRKYAHNGAIVFIHLEAHGGEDGLLLSSGELVDWGILIDELRRINIIRRNYLIVMLAMCHGGWVISRINPFERAPFRAIISCMGPVEEKKLQNSFSAFYSEHFFTLDHDRSIARMNAELSQGDSKFDFFKSEYFFDNFRPDLDPLNFKESLDHNARHLYNNHEKFRRLPFEQFRSKYEHVNLGEYEALKKNRDYFTMKDLRTGKRLRHPPLKLGSTIDDTPL